MKWWERPLWSLDLETTGADPLTAQIVEWALLKVAPSGRIVEMHGGILCVDVPAEATAIHGIGNDTTKHGMGVNSAVPAILQRLWRSVRCGEPLVAFNAAFDLTVFQATAGATAAACVAAETIDRLRVIDPLVIDRHCDKHRRGKRRLQDVCKQYGLELTGWHSALSDALAAAHLAYRIAEEHHELRSLTLDQLHAAQVAWAAEWADGLQNFKRRNGEPTAVVDGSWPVKREGVTT